MASILLTSQTPASFTVVSNVFIDDYMPYAHGDYVKIYLYLLRCLGEEKKDISISSLADRFENTEKDILRAIHYWEQKKLLILSYDQKNTITGISFSIPSDPKIPEETSPLLETIPQEMPVPKNEKNEQPTEITTPTINKRPIYTAEQIACIKEDPEVILLLEQIEHTLQKLLKPSDIQLILYLYEGLGFSTQLILYLYEYCISMNKAHINYIEQVAINWSRDNIRTVEQAELTTKQYKQYQKDYAAIAKALGFPRSLAQAECAFAKKWLEEWNFPIEMVLDACKRTILQTQSANFIYINSILASWHDAGIHTLEQAKQADDIFNKTSAKKIKQQQNIQASNSRTQPIYQRAKNRFTSFEQHHYSKEDMELIERALLRNSENITRKGDRYEPYQ